MFTCIQLIAYRCVSGNAVAAALRLLFSGYSFLNRSCSQNNTYKISRMYKYTCIIVYMVFQIILAIKVSEFNNIFFI